MLDGLLGAVGTVALFVAELGIANSMVMAVLEPYQEIGLMSTVGAATGISNSSSSWNRPLSVSSAELPAW